MDEVFVPKNRFGKYQVRVVWRNGAWVIEGSRADFYDLTSLGWAHFLDLAKRGHDQAKEFLLKNGFVLS